MNKNLIDDIVNYIEAYPRSIANAQSANENEEWQHKYDNMCDVFNQLTRCEQKNILLYALSSPDGRPVCDFLAGKSPLWTKRNNTIKKFRLSSKIYISSIEDISEQSTEQFIDSLLEESLEKTPKTISATLYNTLCNCIEQGKLFDEIEQILNEEYNNLCP